jgi:hypothetical protein
MFAPKAQQKKKSGSELGKLVEKKTEESPKESSDSE